MLSEELHDKLTETLAICDLHFQRMSFAWTSINKHFPLTETSLGSLSALDLALFDQLIYRFSKLQDSMGARLFKQLLDLLEEDTAGLPFIDLLNKMEKLNLLSDAKDWIALRQIRNTLSHEYPFFKEVQADELNLLPANIEKLTSVWLNLRSYTVSRLNQL